MFRLFYISRSQLPEAERDDIVQRIVDVARQRNSSLGISGILIFTGDNFAQVLEGDEAAVRLLMADITRDRGHREVQVLLEEQVVARGYGQWSMAYWGRGGYADRLIAHLRYDRLLSRDSPADMTPLLEFMKTSAEKWASPQS